jgi:putative DNA primase/helicase
MSDEVDRSDNVEILGMGSCRDGHLFFELCVTVGRRRRERILSLEEFEAAPDPVIASLEAGLLTPASRADFRRRVSRAARRMRPTFRVATRPGWFGKSFVLPSGTVIGGDGNLRVCLPAIYQKFGEKFAVRGSLREWRRVAELAVGNSRFMLTLAVVCSGPVASLLKLEPPSVQLVGEVAGAGKSSILAGVGSFWGGRDDELGLFVEGWAQTKNNVDDLAAAHGGTCLVLDDARTFAKRTRAGFADFREAIMRVGEGRQKGRRDDSLSLRSRTPLLSASNDSLDDMARAVDDEVDDALRGRLIDVPLLRGVVGAFECLHGYGDHAEFGAELLRVARENYGVASVALLWGMIRWLERDEAGLVAWLRARREKYLKWARRRVASAARDLTRFHHKFATVYAAGAPAIQLGLFPWDWQALARALLDCERAHVELVAGVAPSGAPPRAAA